MICVNNIINPDLLTYQSIQVNDVILKELIIKLIIHN